jgi:hypothetical protein
MNVAIGFQLGFFLEVVAAQAVPGQRRRGQRPALPWMASPSEGVAYLVATPGGPPSLVSELPAPWDQAILLELVEFSGQSCLLMLANGRPAIRVNGLPTPRLAVLRVGDALQVDPDHLLHVSSRAAAYSGPPRQQDLGKTCPYCRSRIRPETNGVYACWDCSLVYHDEVGDGENLLQCAQLIHECVQCTKSVIRGEEFQYVPET